MTEPAAGSRMTGNGFGYPGGKAGLWLLIAVATAAFLGLISLFWVGFIGSDDSLYWVSTTAWLTHAQSLGTTHWSLRYPLVVPMAITRLIFGDGFFAMVLPSVLYAIGTIILIAHWGRRVGGIPYATAATALVVTNPMFILISSTANIDIVEIFYILSGFLLIDIAMNRVADRAARPVWAALILAGVAIGMGLLSRETTAFAIAAVGLLFLAGYGLPRPWYFAIGLGCALVEASDSLYFWAKTGNVFYRFDIALHHDSTVNRWVEQGSGIPIIHPIIDPVVMVLLNHNFGLLAWFGIPLVIWLWRYGATTGPTKRTVVLFITLAAVWTLFAAEAWGILTLIPRYFLLPSLLLSAVTGIALSRMWQLGWRRLPIAVASVLIVTNLLSAWLDNRSFMFGEHRLVDIASQQAEIIHTDPQTARRAELLLDWRGAQSKVSTNGAGPGELFLFNPARAADTVKPESNWIVVQQDPLPTSGGRLLARHLQSLNLLPAWVAKKIGDAQTSVILYRLP
jgi:4-amino-4-deoxy-L-arabinose transferase-like glycosyltransferase